MGYLGHFDMDFAPAGDGAPHSPSVFAKIGRPNRRRWTKLRELKAIVFIDDF